MNKQFDKPIQGSPTQNDILLGRGGNNNKYSGNEQLRQKAMQHVYEYMACSKTEKIYMVNELEIWVRNLKPPGRFLQKNPDDDDTNKWYEMDRKTARLKVSQVYRDTVARVRGTKGRATSDSRLMEPPANMKHVLMEQINDARLPISESSEQLDFSRSFKSSSSYGMSTQYCKNNGSIKEKTMIERGISRAPISTSPNLTSNAYSRPHMLNIPSAQPDSVLSSFHPNQLEQQSSPLYATGRSNYQDNQSMHVSSLPPIAPASDYQIHPSFHIGQNRFTDQSQQNALDIQSQQLTHSPQDPYYGIHPQTGHIQDISNALMWTSYGTILDPSILNNEFIIIQPPPLHHQEIPLVFTSCSDPISYLTYNFVPGNSRPRVKQEL